MIATITTVFYWFLLFVIFYTYFGYGLIVWIYTKLRDAGKKKNISTGLHNPPPSVAFIIPAYNEQEVIAEKITNTLGLNYPGEKLKIIVVADGSDDGTAGIVKSFANVLLLDGEGRKGKVAAMNRAVENAGDADILVFSDANTSLNTKALQKMMVLYNDPKVGGVSGEKKVRSIAGGEGESVYWKYESALKKIDSDLYSVAGAAGELLSVRKNLYDPLEESIILDDFILSFRICMKGYAVKYEPAAMAIENPSLDLKEEEKRKVRISAGAFQAIKILWPLFNIFKYGIVSFQYISRRFLRWVVCPLALPAVLIFNMILVIQQTEPLMLYKILLYLQVAFYLISLVGGVLSAGGRKVGVFYVAFYFVFMNFSVFRGFGRYLKGTQSANWEKSVRSGGECDKSGSKNT